MGAKPVPVCQSWIGLDYAIALHILGGYLHHGDGGIDLWAQHPGLCQGLSHLRHTGLVRIPLIGQLDPEQIATHMTAGLQDCMP